MRSSSAALRYRMNNHTTWVVTSVVFLTPLILGGNRPAAWTLSASVLFLWGSWYFLRMAIRDFSPRSRAASLGIIFPLFWIMVAYNIVQLLPTAGLLPETWLALPRGADFGDRITLTPGNTVLATLRWLSFGLIFYFTLQIAANSSRSKLFLRVLFGVVAVHALYAMVLFFEFGDAILFIPKWAYFGSVTGAFVNRNSFATFLAIGAIIGAALIIDELAGGDRKNARSRVLDMMDGKSSLIYVFSAWILIVATLVLTNSRMGFFVGFCGVIAVAMLYAVKSRNLTPRSISITVVIGLLLVGAALYLFGETLIDRFGGADIDSKVRADIYQQVIEMIRQRPLIGFGGQSFEYIYPSFHAAPVNFDYFAENTHSTYLALWVEYGVIFGTIPMVIVAACMVYLIRLYRSSSTGDLTTIAAMAVIVAGALHSLVDFSLEMQGVTYLFVVVVATGVAGIARRGRQEG